MLPFTTIIISNKRIRSAHQQQPAKETLSSWQENITEICFKESTSCQFHRLEYSKATILKEGRFRMKSHKVVKSSCVGHQGRAAPHLSSRGGRLALQMSADLAPHEEGTGESGQRTRHSAGDVAKETDCGRQNRVTNSEGTLT